MNIIHDLKKWLAIRTALPATSHIGFVPTMGCLHEGHDSLVQQSVSKNDLTVLSIFVNPTQFNDPSDYEHYPRTLEQDVERARALNVDYVLIPDAKDIYPEGNTIRLTTDDPFSTIMEGPFRPGHFNGMLTVVMKLLTLVRSHRAYFGEKDYQQYVLINRLCQQYFMNTEIIRCPTIRESSGLPLSSRNKRLSADQRELLERFYRFLYDPNKNSLPAIKQKIAALNMQADYVELHDDRLFIALKIGAIRIIDNLEKRQILC